MLDRIIPFAHKKVLEYINSDSICVDMTCGNGNDTLFLAKNSKFVYAFDIQEVAINNTRTLLQENKLENVDLIHESHSYVTDYVAEDVSVAMFNLGYLPQGDENIYTTGSSTIYALQRLLPLMSCKSLISITVYTGHENGFKESLELEEFVKTLSSKYYNVLRYSFLNKKNSPYNIFIEKLGEEK